MSIVVLDRDPDRSTWDTSDAVSTVYTARPDTNSLRQHQGRQRRHYVTTFGSHWTNYFVSCELREDHAHFVRQKSDSLIICEPREVDYLDAFDRQEHSHWTPCEPSEESSRWTTTTLLGQVVPQSEIRHRRRLEPFFRTSFDSSDLDRNLVSFLVQNYFEKFVDDIRSRVVTSVEAEAFLRNNASIVREFAKALDCLENTMQQIPGNPYSIECDFWQDSEAPQFKALEIIVKVNVADYQRVQELWKAADKAVYGAIDPEAKKQIVVLFERVQ
jgi:hypothetical protein